MTNAEINLRYAIKALEEGRLNDREAVFIEEIRDYDKRRLRGLTSRQYAWLAAIADKADGIN